MCLIVQAVTVKCQWMAVTVSVVDCPGSDGEMSDVESRHQRMLQHVNVTRQRTVSSLSSSWVWLLSLSCHCLCRHFVAVQGGSHQSVSAVDIASSSITLTVILFDLFLLVAIFSADVTVTACSHHRHRQDKTKLSCLVLSVSAVWTRYNSKCFILPHFAPYGLRRS